MKRTISSPPEPMNHDAVRAAILQAAATPQTLTLLKKAAKAATTKLHAKAAEIVVEQMITTGELHPHSTGASPRYGRDRPPLRNDPEKVRNALLHAADPPKTLAQLVKIAIGETQADKKFVEAEAQKLIADGLLHKQGPQKSAPYGRHKPIPPHPLEVPPGKTELSKLIGAAQKLLTKWPEVSVAELLERLQAALAGQPTARPVAVGPTIPQSSSSAARHVPPATTASTVVVSPPPTLTSDSLHASIKEAYEELCLDPDFRDRLVEIRRLYRRLQRKQPAVALADFHQALLQLEKQRIIELHDLNEVQRAKEPELAIRRNDRLLYYVIWR
ncbi:MAG: hypothetical protein RMJ56_00115 [Gemmataceae bacterium]|nr:hypothetical protein [Gemmata sp.]MDW8195984.1 hypothetical protein [Gemmataceae bacterium]